MTSAVYANPEARDLVAGLGLEPVPARLRLRAGRAGFRLYLAEHDTGRAAVELGTFRTLWRAGLALRGILRRAGWDFTRDGSPGLVVREVEITAPLRMATLKGAEND